ncbi:LLM class flavin-dependent oxidoreductase [Paraburkholderia caribensis]|uniref:LLM class flavin-dependent oxidoreductase n=1 Tax=Paraburkholderia caribensis TaxID=75105 RepID=A0A9Q6S4L2_9BURK|nr:LLM class flavin-dependent oxidoreductase [Paraburkholderia caribensis]MCO4877287.1 LLM class flavin-dependent oxidoreductase [Paraburkholderia caribensis]PTB28930.1 nitrilotriacetate monooxygenase [Paraburkholderia caribensis]QLB64431.1 nitrilotriacetate monooxygenase [Paraburkholderia caribensis]
MSSRKGHLRLGAFLYPTGHHIAAWRHPDSLVDAGRDFRHYVQLAQAAEAAKFDLVFLADGAGTRGDNVDFLSRTAHSYVAQFEPLTLLSALAAVTQRIGLVGTASTTFNEPYHIARKFASLDHISGGRAGWNLVTSSSALEAKNFNFDEHLAHARRYERAVEFAEVVEGLWDSWDEDAFVRDKASGRYFDPSKRHVLDHRGEFFNVRGPLNVERSPQGRPVVVQAGSSEAGKALAARTAEVIFTAQQTLGDAVAFYADVKGRMAAYGREPDDLKIMPGVMPIVGVTESEAREKFDALQALIDPAVGLALVSTVTGGFDLSGYPLDGPIPELPETNASKSRQSLALELARRENLTIRELYLRIAGARGHWQLVGTAEQIVDALEERFVNYGADGYNVMPALLPNSLDDFIRLVLPELLRRGLFRSEYEGRTLRENLGLARPVSRYARETATS